MARGKYRGGKATGRRTFSSQDELERENAEARNPKPRDMPESDSEEDSDAEREKSAQGVRGLIETANPNAAPRRQNMKASELKGVRVCTVNFARIRCGSSSQTLSGTKRLPGFISSFERLL